MKIKIKFPKHGLKVGDRIDANDHKGIRRSGKVIEVINSNILLIETNSNIAPVAKLPKELIELMGKFMLSHTALEIFRRAEKLEMEERSKLEWTTTEVNKALKNNKLLCNYEVAYHEGKNSATFKEALAGVEYMHREIFTQLISYMLLCTDNQEIAFFN